MIHVFPINDLIDHDLDGIQCICDPTVEWGEEDFLVIHHSLDGREKHEKPTSSPPASPGEVHDQAETPPGEPGAEGDPLAW